MGQRLLGQVAVVLGLILVLLLGITRITERIVDVDLWHELSLAREFIRLGYVPAADLFAFTPTVEPSVHHEWGAGIIAYAALAAGGGTAVMLLNAVIAAATLTLALVHAYRRGAEPSLTAVLALPSLLLLARGFPPIRAQAYSYLFFAILLLSLDWRRRGARGWIALWLPAFVLWVNIHASFVLAFAIVGAYILESLLDRRPSYGLMATAAAMVGLTFVNPYGAALYAYLVRALPLRRAAIPEWSAVWTGTDAPVLLPVVAISLALAVYALVHAKLDVPAMVIVLITAVAGCMHMKMLPYYAVAWLAFVPAWLKPAPLSGEIVRIVLSRQRVSRIIWFFGMVALAAGLVAAPFWSCRVPDAEPFALPVGPVEYLRQSRFAGNVMTRFNHGAYVTWKLYPHVRVSMDSRYEVAYSDSLCYENERAFTDERRWSAFVDRYRVDAVIVERGQRLDLHIPEVRAWKRVYRDGVFGIWAREELQLPVVDTPSRRFEGTLP